MNTDEKIARIKELWKEYTYPDDTIHTLQDETPEGEFKPVWVETVEEGESRWMIHTLEVFEIEEGVYVGVRWERGKTEMQENLFEDDNVYRVDKEIVQRVDWSAKEAL